MTTSKLDQANLERYMLNAGIFTYPGLCKEFHATETQKMQIDRTIQKLRRKGELVKRRQGHIVYWQNADGHPVNASVIAQCVVIPRPAFGNDASLG